MHMDTCHLLKTKKTKYDNNNIDWNKLWKNIILKLLS
jgi:hypothetical protein